MIIINKRIQEAGGIDQFEAMGLILNITKKKKKDRKKKKEEYNKRTRHKIDTQIYSFLPTTNN
jgi:hypothetical protein